MQQPQKKTLFTQEAYEKMLARRKQLHILLDEVKERIQAAREMGDLSENGAYKYGKFERARLLRELRELNEKIDNGEIQAIKAVYSSIEFGATFTIALNDQNVTYQLTNEYESDPAQKKISDKSPIGMAVLHKKVGDTAVVDTPRGKQYITVLIVK